MTGSVRLLFTASRVVKISSLYMDATVLNPSISSARICDEKRSTSIVWFLISLV